MKFHLRIFVRKKAVAIHLTDRFHVGVGIGFQTLQSNDVGVAWPE